MASNVGLAAIDESNASWKRAWHGEMYVVAVSETRGEDDDEQSKVAWKGFPKWGQEWIRI